MELRKADDAVELAVSNHGEPIPHEMLDAMFEPMRRGAVANGGLEQSSLGLGLFIVRQIAAAHGGTVQAASESGMTRFTLRLSPA